MKLQVKAIFISLFCFSPFFLKSQISGDYSKINKPCPDYTFSRLVNSKQNEIRISQLRGKVVILDLWATSCLPCIKAMPHLDSLQKKFEDKIQILPIAMQLDNKVEELFERLILQKKITRNVLMSALDTSFCQYFQTKNGWLGQYVVLDTNGIVRYYTSDKNDLSVENIDFLLTKNQIPLLEVRTKERLNKLINRLAVDPQLPFFISGNGGDEGDILYRSILTKANANRRIADPTFISSLNRNMIQFALSSIIKLYDVAYGDTINHYPDALGRASSYGKYWKEPILEVIDSSLFKADFNTMKNLYTYSLIVPENRNTDFLQRTMQDDLKRYFGFDVMVEQRSMPCWKLIALSDAKSKLLSKLDKQVWDNGRMDIIIGKGPIRELIYKIWAANQNEPPFIDNTGIDYEIDIKISGIEISDLSQLKLALRKNGLDLIKGETEMNVIVIRDNKN